MAQDKNKEKIITALLSTTSTRDAAKVAKVSEATIYRYLGDDEFNTEYRKVRRNVVENTVAQIQGVAEKAVATLERSLTCGNPAVEVRAAQIVLENTYKGLLELTDVVARIEAIEEAQKQQASNEKR